MTTALVGRDREVEELRSAIASAAGGRGRVVLIEGEPGIGKTRLVSTACDHARASGLAVFEGSCDDLAPARPFGPLITALGVGETSPDTDLGELATSNPGQQFQLTEALGAAVERHAERSPLLLALDDLQWADPSTLVALRSIARRVPTLPVLVIAAARAGHQVVELHRVTDDLLRRGATRLGLGPLDDDSVASLITEVLDEAPTDVLLERAQGASGNPLFVIEYVRSVQASGAGGEPDAVDFRVTVQRRLAGLPPATSDALRLAALLGSTFSAADLATASGRTIVELTASLHEAIVSSIIEEHGDQLAFRHALVRDAIYDQIPLALRRQLHREIGRSLAAAGADALTVAHHLGLGAGAEDPEAVAWLRRAASEAARRSPATAVELLERARELLEPTSRERNAVLGELAVALAWSGRLAEATELGTELLARRLEPSVAGPLRCGLVYALTWQGKPTEALRHAELGPDDEIDERDAALLLAEAAMASLLAFDFPSAASRAKEARDAAERLGHEVALCHALSVLTWVALFAGRAAEAVELGLRAVDIADRSTSGEAHLAHPRFFVAQPLLSVSFEDAEAMLRQGLQLAERLGQGWSLPLYHSRLGAFAFMRGEWDTAVAECETALAVADEVGLHVASVAVSAAWLAAIQVHRDDLDAAERTLAVAMSRHAEEGPQLGTGVINWARAEVLDARGRREEALALLQAAWDLYRAGGPVTDPWSIMAFVRLLVATGQHQRAAELLAVFDEQAKAVGASSVLSPDAMCCRGLVEQDPEILLRSVDLYREWPPSHHRAQACEDAAVLLASRGRLEEAVPLWDEATDLYAHLGATRDIARVAAQLRQHGIRRGTRRRHVRATSGWESLTETEHKVVALVCQRLSNPEVAERLFISRHTVESHLKNIYRKLGLASRSELAAEASRHG